MDEVTVAAGLLHDTIEDTLTTPDELRRLFGEQVAFLVEGLTKIAQDRVHVGARDGRRRTSARC